MWGALWLFRATGEQSYLVKAQTAYGSIINGSPVPVLKWVHAWDDKT